MLILDVNKLSKNFGYGTLFEALSFSLNDGERVSIVGPNGCGKSTLLKIIAGLERADSGMINIKKEAKVAYLDQTAPDNTDSRKVLDILKSAFSELNEMQIKMDALLNRMTNELNTAGYEKVVNQYSILAEKFQAEGGYEIETNIDIVCNGLNISKDLLNQEYTLLSGGEKTLIHLAKALLLKPDLFLLDEPTNHLDIKRIEWLETYIKSFKGAVVIVSHDRYFLDRMSSKIIEIDNGEATVYNTNYSGYLEEKENNFRRLLANYNDQQEYFKKLEEQIKFFAERGMATNSSTMTKRASTLQTRLDRERARAIKRPREQKNIKIDFDELQKSSKRVLEVNNLSVSAPSKQILNSISLRVNMGERIAIIGENGSGKSTFIKTILGEQVLPHTGQVFVGPSVKIGYIPQIINFKQEKQTVLEYFKEEVALNEQRVRSILAGFQFSKEDIAKRVGMLSGGERIRLRLAILLQQQVNTLIFDEPTNHIDIPTKETLEEALEDFEGTLLFISHDRYFINKFAQKIIEFSGGKTTTYLGNYEDYRQQEKTNPKR